LRLFVHSFCKVFPLNPAAHSIGEAHAARRAEFSADPQKIPSEQ
jgi:hypothetical protein